MIQPKTQIQMDYYKLLADLLKIKSKVQKQFHQSTNKLLAQGYWQMGKRICKEEMFKKNHTNQTGPVLDQLAKSLGMEYSLLTRIVKFYKTWPEKCPVQENTNMTWSHYRQLISIRDEAARDFYLKEAQKNRWRKTELSTRIKNDFFETSNASSSSKGQLLRSKERLYCYAGKVLKVVDGDTLLMDVDLGFNVHVHARLRLRGIDTAEMDAEKEKVKKQAQEAKDFVCRALSGCEIVSFQTFHVDSYGRYVADVFYLPGETKRQLIFEKGIFLNQQLLDVGLAMAV